MVNTQLSGIWMLEIPQRVLKEILNTGGLKLEAGSSFARRGVHSVTTKL